MRPQQLALREEGIIYVGFWEPIHFFKHLGRAAQSAESRLDFIKSEDFIKYAADLGVNQLWSNFSKGYGLAFEDKEQRKIQTVCEYAKKYNMRVIAYCTGGSLTPETVKLDYPDNPEIVDDMVVRRADGRWASYGNNGYQNWRARPDYTSPDYMEWQKKTIKKALDFGCDGIHFDNTNILPEPAACRCERCDRMYHEFLEEMYSGDNAAAGMERWGRTEMQHTTIPWYDEWNDPVMDREVTGANSQTWMMFRQKIFNDCLSEWADYIHELGGMCEYNCGKNPGSNYRGYGAVNDEILLEKADIVFNEGTYKLGYTTSNAPITRIRSHKIAQAFDIPMMNYNATPHMMAEAFSFNPGMLGMWQAVARPEDNQDKLTWFDFYHTYKHYQTKQASLAETGVFLHHESMTFSMLNIYMTITALTQLLQEERIPFNLLYKKHLDNLSQYKLVIVPDAYCLKEWEADKLAAYVKSGGRVLTVGRTGERTDNFLIRTKVKTVKTLEDLYSAEERENIFTPLTGEDFQSNFLKPVGEGMMAHITALDYEDAPNSGDRGEYMIRQELIRRPANAAAVMSAIDTLLPQRNIQVQSGADLLIDLCKRDDTAEGLVHIFNVSWAREVTAQADVTIKWDEPVKTLTWIGWDREETPIAFTEVEGGLRFRVEDIRESAVIIINKV